jgi:hypothetical protein
LSLTTPSILSETFCKATCLTQRPTQRRATTTMPPAVAWRICVPNMLCIATITFYLLLRRGPVWSLRSESPSQTDDAQLLNQSVDKTISFGVHHVNPSEAFEKMRKKGFVAPVSKPCLLISLDNCLEGCEHGAMVAVQNLGKSKLLFHCLVLGCWCYPDATDATDASAFCPVFSAVLLQVPATA